MELQSLCLAELLAFADPASMQDVQIMAGVSQVILSTHDSSGMAMQQMLSDLQMLHINLIQHDAYRACADTDMVQCRADKVHHGGKTGTG